MSTRTFRFDDVLIGGFTLKLKIGLDEPKYALIAECVKRAVGVLDQLNLEYLKQSLMDKNFIITESLKEIFEKTEEEITLVKAM